MSIDQEQPQMAVIESELQNSETEEGFGSNNAEIIGPEVIRSDASPKKDNEQMKNKPPIFKLIVSSVLLAFLIILLPKGNESEAPIFTYQSDNAIQIYTDEASQETYIYNAQGELLHKIDMYTEYFMYNLDHSAAAIGFIERFTGFYFMSLYYANASEVRLIKRGISFYGISDSGNYVMYSQGQSQGGSALFLYNIQEKSEVLIDSGKQSYTALCFSPDDNTVLFASETYSTMRGLEYRSEGFIISDISSGNLIPVSIGVDRLPIAVSDQAEYIYFGLSVKNSPYTNLYVKYNDETRKLAENCNKVFLNKDHTEIMYYDGTATKLCIRGAEINELANNSISRVILPDKGTRKADIMYRTGTHIFGVEFFRNTTVLCEDGSLLLINDQYKPIHIDMVYGEEPISLSKDINTVTYLNTQGALNQVKHLRGKWKTEVLREDIDHWLISEDMTQIYYTQDGKLYYYRDKNEPSYIMDGVDRLYLQANGTDIYFLTGAEGEWNLFACSNGVPSPVETVGVINAIEYTINGLTFRQELGDDFYRDFYPYQRILNVNPGPINIPSVAPTLTPPVVTNTTGEEALTDISGFQPIQDCFLEYAFLTGQTDDENSGSPDTIISHYDLNGDGREDDIIINLKGGSITSYIEVNQLRLTFEVDNPYDGEVHIIDLDKNDPYLEVACFDDGPSGDPHYVIFRYDGTHIYESGRIDAFATMDGKGKLISSFHQNRYFEPKFCSAWYEIVNNAMVLKNNKIDQYLGQMYDFSGGEAYFIPYEKLPVQPEIRWEEVKHFEPCEVRLIDIWGMSEDDRLLNYYFVELPTGETGLIYFWIGD